MESNLGPIFTPRFFCCDDPNELGISEGKQPVAVIDLSPNPAFVAETVNYTGTASYDPDGSITGYAWLFESHTPSSGTASAGTLNYATGGTYTIQLIVTDGTGLKSAPARTELVIQNEEALQVYIAQAGSGGIFYKSGTAAWENKNEDLDLSSQAAYDTKIDPVTQFLPEANKTIWRAGLGGVFASNDGGVNWSDKSPGSVANSWGDGTVPTIADLTFREFLFAGTYLLVSATWTSASNYRAALFYSTNYGDVRTDLTSSVTWAEISNGFSS